VKEITKLEIISIAKEGKDKSAPGLKSYINSNNSSPFGIRFSIRDLKLDGKILNLPLFLIDQFDKIVQFYLKKIK